MADLVSYGNANRDIDQAIIALKKGAQLLKYGRKGKPKFCPFRLSTDESTLIWISSSERSLKLASFTRIVPGQRTAVFHRYLRPEKDYLSFSLPYNNGTRSLDLGGKHLTSNSPSDSSASGARDSGSPDYEFKLKVFS
ncbi:PH, RCC1 and FYVE domains-containing protein 1-like isoform X2 [Pyrus x bretschneideri]|uniref:PH, RCC1 and FYVE domains-containing protein 1-like isoform X2 n=1 Tax=Pyrus x bretschneideri TaxID=225117 RepID=UPI00202F6E5A|nr:PH, RCC1 and FYVE domains-containing protein 1-like isoform X2 [Pyrus x bretschneideri]